MNDFFLDSVEREVRQNVRRIKKHPSNVQWAGSNEIEVIIRLLNSSTVPVDLGSVVVPPGPLEPRFINNVSAAPYADVSYELIRACS